MATKEIGVVFHSRFTMFDHVCLQSPRDEHKEQAIVSFLTAALHPVIMFYEHLGCVESMEWGQYIVSTNPFLGFWEKQIDWRTLFKMINFLHKCFRKRDINWSIWRIFCIKQQIFMLCKYHWKERCVLKWTDSDVFGIKARLPLKNVLWSYL